MRPRQLSHQRCDNWLAPVGVEKLAHPKQAAPGESLDVGMPPRDEPRRFLHHALAPRRRLDFPAEPANLPVKLHQLRIHRLQRPPPRVLNHPHHFAKRRLAPARHGLQSPTAAGLRGLDGYGFGRAFGFHDSGSSAFVGKNAAPRLRRACACSTTSATNLSWSVHRTATLPGSKPFCLMTAFKVGVSNVRSQKRNSSSPRSCRTVKTSGTSACGKGRGFFPPSVFAGAGKLLVMASSRSAKTGFLSASSSMSATKSFKT